VRLRQLFPPDPGGVGVDAAEAYLPPALASARTGEVATPSGGRPWITTNMVASVDGAMNLEGRSGGLGSAADRTVFHTLRSMADVVMAGAGTVRTEGYGPARLDDEYRAARLARGQAAVPTVVVVSNSGRLGDELPLLDPELVGDGPLPILLTSATGATAAAPLGGRVEVLVAGDTEVDLPLGLTMLAERGVVVVVCEGGPVLNGALIDGGLLDELCLTTSPLLTAGAAGRIVAGVDERLVNLELAHLLEADGSLFARWRLLHDEHGDPPHTPSPPG